MFSDLSLVQMFLLALAAFLAGLVDAVVGGGGLVQIPALLSIFPQLPPATVFGTNKLSGVWGTSAAALRFGRSVKVEWGAALPGAVSALVFSFLGAVAVTRVPADFLRKLLPLILVAVAAYTLYKKDLGAVHAPAYSGATEKILSVLLGAGIGFYDGFFGPGTGSFLVFVYVRVFGFDFLGASAAAKIVNVACNLSALAWFGFSGHLFVAAGLGMAVFNVGGSLVGSRLAIKHGSGFVRVLFLVVVGILVLKTGYDAFLK